MPSDTRLQPSLDALRRPIATYRSHVASARERVRALLATGGGTERARLELGTFGGARIDVSRFAELRQGGVLDALSRARLERASAVLDELAASDDALFTADVAPGDSLRVTAARALAHAGRVFGAVNVAELVRAGRYEPERHDRMLDAYPIEWWNRAEREQAPPLVIAVDGADLRAGSLAELLDVGMRLVLLVRGPSTPAPLVRLVTPGTLIMQTRDVEALARVADSAGPAIAAIFDQEAAIFTHDPLAGNTLWQRLTIVYHPTTPSRKSLAGMSARQQQEELLQLQALAERPTLPNGPVEALVPSGAGDATDRLTAWLLNESGLANGK
jgi:hypothetical protein